MSLIGLALGGAVGLLALPARAQDGTSEVKPLPDQNRRFGSQWNLVLSAEDLVVAGHSWSPRQELASGRDAWGTEDNLYQEESVSGFWSPVRFAADLFVLPNLSLGAALRVTHESSVTTEIVEVSGSDIPTQRHSLRLVNHHTALTFSPRLGYAHWLGGGIGTWIRAGVDIGAGGHPPPFGTRPQASDDQRIGMEFTALGVVQPLPHSLIAFGPTYRYAVSTVGEPRHLVALAVNLGVEF